jgi:hypothetical protein
MLSGTEVQLHCGNDSYCEFIPDGVEVEELPSLTEWSENELEAGIRKSRLLSLSLLPSSRVQ